MPAGFQSSRDITHYAGCSGLPIRPGFCPAPIWQRPGCARILAAARHCQGLTAWTDGRPSSTWRSAGVSKSTVSLVLQNSPLVRPEDTRDDVRRVMAEIGYVYNRAAANLRSANAGLIGLVINDLRNPFFTEFATSVQMALSEPRLCHGDRQHRRRPRAAGAGGRLAMLEHGVSALVVSPAYGDEERTDLFPFSSFSYPEGSRDATRHLIAAGARRIAFVGGLEDRPITRERLSGYLDVMQEAGLDPLMLHGRATRAFGTEAALRLAAEFPDVDAAISYNDLVALGMMSGFLRTGRKVGRDFLLVGFDDIEECAQVWPQLSSVRCDISTFGRQTATAILDWLEQGVQPEKETRAPVQLVVRASSAGVDA
jgi:LacI family transcriptional regulator